MGARGNAMLISYNLNILALHLLEEIGRLILLDIFARTCQKQASEPEKP
jgi:hypothetical protein